MKILFTQLFCLVFSTVVAQTTMYEQEPNNDPNTVNPISVPIVILGEMQNNDQDMFVWEVSDVEAGYLWSIELTGIPDAHTKIDVMQLTFTEDGTGVTGVNKLFSINSTGSTIIKESGLIFAPATYYLGLSFAGGKNASPSPLLGDSLLPSLGDDFVAENNKIDAIKTKPQHNYQIKINKGKKLQTNSTNQNSQESPKKLTKANNNGVFFEQDNAWLKFNLTAEEAEHVWKIDGAVSIGNVVTLDLYNDQGEKIASSQSNAMGRYFLADLKLAEGSYLMGLTSQIDAITQFEIFSEGAYIEGNEAEPNDKYETANHFEIGNSVSAKVNSAKDKDFFKFQVTAADTAKQYDLKLLNNNQSQFEVCLYKGKRNSLQCKSAAKDIILSQLKLNPGEYQVAVSKGKLNSQYSLEMNSIGTKPSLMEAEPNDDFAEAKHMNQKRIVKGRFNGKEADYFVFDVNQESQVWTIQAIGEAIKYLALYNTANKEVQHVRFNQGTKRAKLAQLKLLPGQHYVKLVGENSSYILRAFPTGPFDESFESEPNDILTHAQAIAFDQAKKGLLQSKADKDFYRFRLNNEQPISLKMTPAADADISYRLSWEGIWVAKKASQAGETLSFQGTMPAGDYHIEVKAVNSPSDNIYQIELNNINLASCQHDCEPNDSAHQANTIHPAIALVGESATHDDYDWYQLPPYATETTVTFKNKTGAFNNNLHGYINYDNNLDAQLNQEKNHLSFVVPANQVSYYRIGKRAGKYDYQVLIDQQAVDLPERYENINVNLHKVPKTVQAYSPYGQIIEAMLTIENTGAQTQQLHIHPEVNDHRWQVDLTQVSLNQGADIKLNAKDTVSMPVIINVPNELLRNQVVRLGFIINNPQGFVAQTWQDIKVEVDAPMTQAKPYWSIDKTLLGGINVAATAMGAARTAQDIIVNNKANGSGYEHLFDGVVGDGLGMYFRKGRKVEQDYITIDLAGDGVNQVQGILLNPLSSSKPSEYLKDFDLHVSVDGINFQSVLKSTLAAVKSEQSFVLPQAKPAKFARLYLLNSHQTTHKPQEKPPIALGEWKVIASPTQPYGEGLGFNIADPQLGGYVVWSVPETSNYWDVHLLTEKHEHKSLFSRSNKEWEWVVGFHHQRAAKIDKIQWLHSQVETKNKAKTTPLDHVKIMSSTESNVGPWTLVAEKDFKNMQNMDEIIFKQPIWARYLKFSVGGVKPSNRAYLPETIRVIEHPAGKDYQSIIGEWGELSLQAIFEHTHSDNTKTELTDGKNHSKSAAIDLTESQVVSGQVQLEHADKLDWYKVTSQAGSNTLKINLAGKLTIETEIKVEDSQGNNVPLISHKKETNNIEYHISVEPNKDYFIKVEEPPRSVVFVWDTSGSTEAYHPMIYEAISSYSNDVIAGRDSVNFLPFGGKMLMKDWYGNPLYLKTILNNYKRNDHSSNAEEYLYDASRALEDRQGSKAVIIITDAITSKHEELWDALKVTQPRVFSIGIIRNGFGGKSDRQIDLMQSWSRVNNGDFQQVINATQVENAFDRVAVKLRQPADYTLKVSSEFIQAPGPGTLLIAQAEDGQSSAVELILDASGSMLKRLDGKRRINIAKEVLISAVSETIPAGTPLALRVFGDKQANACRTDLAIKLSPLDPIKAKATLSKINAKNLAKTPIADSLAKVASDLKTHQGKKIVILVTDGEETCEGDPEAVINELVEQGIDVRLNIVGFAIDDEALKEQFNQWSKQGGGKYFDSKDSESLKQSVAQALKTPFSVFSLSGDLIKEGVVNGEPLELPAGIYNIKVYGDEVQTYQNYQIKGESDNLIKLSPKT